MPLSHTCYPVCVLIRGDFLCFGAQGRLLLCICLQAPDMVFGAADSERVREKVQNYNYWNTDQRQGCNMIPGTHCDEIGADGHFTETLLSTLGWTLTLCTAARTYIGVTNPCGSRVVVAKSTSPSLLILKILKFEPLVEPLILIPYAPTSQLSSISHFWQPPIRILMTLHVLLHTAAIATNNGSPKVTSKWVDLMLVCRSASTLKLLLMDSRSKLTQLRLRKNLPPTVSSSESLTLPFKLQEAWKLQSF